jgi:hypothetical protein
MNTERLLLACLLSLNLTTIACCEDQRSPWWLKPHRMLQTNLREIDATMDIDRYIQDLKDWKINVVKFNVGGIVANYPTDVKYHWRNTFMEGDLTELEPEQLDRFALVIVPDAGGLDRKQVVVLDDYVKRGGRLLLTQEVPKGLQSLGKVELLESRPSEMGAYVRIRPEDKATLTKPALDDLYLVFLGGHFQVYQTSEDVTKLLRLIPADMFGPPEKCYYRHVSDHPALIHRKYGNGAVACFTFGIGAHYVRWAHQGHAALLLGAIDNVLGTERRAVVTAPHLVEINQRTSRHRTFEWISLYNHTGQRGNALHMPVPISGIRVDFRPRKPVRAVRLLGANQELTFVRKNDISPLKRPRRFDLQNVKLL